MAKPRRSRREVAVEGETALRAALESTLADALVEAAPEGGPDVLVTLPDGRRLAIEVKATAQRAEPGPISNALHTWDRELARLRDQNDDEVIGLVVGGTIPDSTRALLQKRGWSWLDRRGDLYLAAPGLYVRDSSLPPLADVTPAPSRDPIRGRVGSTVAARLLMTPDDPPSLRAIAREGNVSVSTASEAMRSLRDAALVGSDGRPLLPDLFWALADAWAPEPVSMARVPEADDRHRLHLERSETDPGWALGGTLAAVAWDAPLVATADYPPDFYVRDHAELAAATRTLGVAPTPTERACTVAVAPTDLVVTTAEPGPHLNTTKSWPVAHPLFAALDLAQDTARGAETLDAWQPPAPYRRVW